MDVFFTNGVDDEPFFMSNVREARQKITRIRTRVLMDYEIFHHTSSVDA